VRDSRRSNYEWLWRFLWLIAGQHAKMRLLREAKRQGVAAYLRVLQGTRRALLGIFLLYFFLQIVTVAAVGAVVTGLWLWDYDVHSKLQIAFGVCLGVFVLPVLLLMVGFSERLWYKASGASKMVDEIIENKTENRAA
jgi:hypothetical protein